MKRFEITVAVIHKDNGHTVVEASYRNTLATTVLQADSLLTAAEALALLAVDMRMNGVNDAAVRARDFPRG